jgi:hypothetical protein
MKVYIIGSLRNAAIPEIGARIREAGHTAFDDWHAAGPAADDCWRDYEMSRGRDYAAALDGDAAGNVFAFDKRHIDASDAVILVLPAGRSGHLELGYAIGAGKLGFILLDAEYDRWDVMYRFAHLVTKDLSIILPMLKMENWNA